MVERDEVPGWLVGLLITFGVTAAISAGWFVYNHVQASATYELCVAVDNDLNRLAPIPARLQEKLYDRNREIGLDQDLLNRRTKLAQLGATRDDERMVMDLQLLPKHHDHLREMTDAIEQQKATVKQLLDSSKRARQELALEEEQALNRERESERNLLKDRQQIEQASLDKAENARQARAKSLVLEGDVRDREDRVKELLDRREIEKEELRSDGQILQAKVTEGFVIVNRGLDQDLHKGTRFQVYNRRGGKNVIKGEIEITEVEQRLAVARVLGERDVTNPIIPGDHIHNPVYNPDEIKIFVIAGDFKKYSKEEMRRFIEESGNRVEPTITEKTHYLVAGDNAKAVLELARLNGVHVVSEEQVLDLVRRQERFAVHHGLRFALAGNFSQLPEAAIRTWIQRNGGILLKEPSNDMHVLIAGEGEQAADAISRARLVGATIIHQDQLIHIMETGRTSVRRE